VYYSFMSKAGQLRRKVNREIQRQLQKTAGETTPKQRSHAKRILAFLAFVLGAPRMVVGALQLLPRLSVVPQNSLDDRNPFLAPFVISNDGYVTLYDLHASCFPVYVQLVGTDGKGGQIVLRPTPGYREEDVSTGMTSPNFAAAKLLPGNKMAFPCNMILPSDFYQNLAVGRADITYTVTYHVFGVPLKRHHVNHFSLSRDASGHARWLEEPLVN
jgi:hypothetical protein